MPKKSGFTLIELLIVVTILAILSGIIIVIINPEQLRVRARNGVRSANVAKIAQATQAFILSEGVYPGNTDELKNSKYINSWPSDSEYTYGYLCPSGNQANCMKYCISTPMATVSSETNKNTYFKYVSGSLKVNSIEYGSKVLSGCTHWCGPSFPDIDVVTGCQISQ